MNTDRTQARPRKSPSTAGSPSVLSLAAAQISLDLAGWPSADAILERIRDESEKGRWFEQLFIRIALQQPEFEIEEIWRRPDWPERGALTGLDGRDMGVDLVARRTAGGEAKSSSPGGIP